MVAVRVAAEGPQCSQVSDLDSQAPPGRGPPWVLLQSSAGMCQAHIMQACTACAAAAALLGCAEDTLPHWTPKVEGLLVDTLSVDQADGLRVLAWHVCH